LIVGFIGVVIAMNPTSDAFQWVAIFPLICAATYAVSQIIARIIGDRETTITTGFYTIAMSGVLIVPLGWLANQVFEFGPEFSHLRWEWPGLTLTGTAQLALLGVVGMVGYMMVSRAYQIAHASLVAPFDYTYLPIATLMAYFLWDEVPTWTTLVGMVLIVISGTYLGYRELRNARKNQQSTIVAESTFAPGNPNASMSLSADIESSAPEN
jgi:drug/metabolite transporter (DMT)-like permease